MISNYHSRLGWDIIAASYSWWMYFYTSATVIMNRFSFRRIFRELSFIVTATCLPLHILYTRMNNARCLSQQVSRRYTSLYSFLIDFQRKPNTRMPFDWCLPIYSAFASFLLPGRLHAKKQRQQASRRSAPQTIFSHSTCRRFHWWV